jgi:hypothetical protein
MIAPVLSSKGGPRPRTKLLPTGALLKAATGYGAIRDPPSLLRITPIQKIFQLDQASEAEILIFVNDSTRAFTMVTVGTSLRFTDGEISALVLLLGDETACDPGGRCRLWQS